MAVASMLVRGPAHTTWISARPPGRSTVAISPSACRCSGTQCNALNDSTASKNSANGSRRASATTNQGPESVAAPPLCAVSIILGEASTPTAHPPGTIPATARVK